MIGRLRGVIAERNLDGSCVLDVAGVGYEIFVPIGALSRLAEPPEEVIVHIHTHVREDALVLYGFPSLADRDAFRTVLGVSGVGPKIALAILSALPAESLAQAIALGDHAVFKGIPGVGKKTAERLLLELKDKIGEIAARTASALGGARTAARPPPRGPLATVAGALVQMGFKPVEANQAVASLQEPDGRPIEELLREALTHLG
jgi:Holliday junction DNA helicase RuvA